MYKRILLKISGEALAGEKGVGIDPETVKRVVSQLVQLHEKGWRLPLWWAAATFGGDGRVPIWIA